MDRVALGSEVLLSTLHFDSIKTFLVQNKSINLLLFFVESFQGLRIEYLWWFILLCRNLSVIGYVDRCANLRTWKN
jgi:hypothetical protein